MDWLAIIFIFWLPHHCVAKDTDENPHLMVERINLRYDDFFRRMGEVDAKEQRRDSEANEIKGVRRLHAEQVEAARADYVKSRKKAIVDPALEAAWNHQQQEHVEELKMARHRYVLKKQEIENVLQRGRRIPEKKEYDLED